MIATIDRRATGVHLRRLMDKKDISVKHLQRELELASVQSIYHWLNGITLPTLDNLYAMSGLFGVAMDDIICGSLNSIVRRKPIDVFIETLIPGNIAVDYKIEL